MSDEITREMLTTPMTNFAEQWANQPMTQDQSEQLGKIALEMKADAETRTRVEGECQPRAVFSDPGLEVREALEVISTWIRRPDYDEDFSLDVIAEWINARPLSQLQQIVAALSKPPAPVSVPSVEDVARLKKLLIRYGNSVLEVNREISEETVQEMEAAHSAILSLFPTGTVQK